MYESHINIRLKLHTSRDDEDRKIEMWGKMPHVMPSSQWLACSSHSARVCVCVCGVPRYVIIDSRTAVEEYNDSNDGCRDQHLCVDS